MPAVPKSRATAAVASMASIPQMVTLAAPTSMGAPPTRAAIDPSATRHKSDTTATTGTNVPVGATRMVRTGTQRQPRMSPLTQVRPAADAPRVPRSGRARPERVRRAPPWPSNGDSLSNH